MYCEVCQKNIATIHYTKVINGDKQEKHLCEACAENAQEFKTSFSTVGLLPDFSMSDFIGSFFHQGLQSNSIESSKMQQQSGCSSCGMSVEEFHKIGRMGCSGCYDHFANQMPVMLQRIHGNTNHIGKIPARGKAVLAKRKQCEQLKAQLQQAVAQEDFEQAAQLRDQIRQLEATDQDGGGSHVEMVD